ncbi:MAG: flagellar basal body L-ring protein FlgH [Thermodesulfobacteriota bacterium]
MNLRSIVTAVLILALTIPAASCGGRGAREPLSGANVDAALRNPPVELYPTPPVKTEGSLFADEAKANLFSDFKARNVGDIITINVTETSKASKNAKTQLGRSNQVAAGITSLIGFENYKHPLIETVLGPEFNLATGIEASYKSKFTGDAKTTRDESMTAQISARIIQVLPNGNLVIRGSREITVNYEKQYIIIQGVIRPQDVSPDNTISSSYIADAKIDYAGEGDLSRQQRQGWLSRLLDYIWPF